MSKTPTDPELADIYRRANGEDVGKAQPITSQRVFAAMRAAMRAAIAESGPANGPEFVVSIYPSGTTTFKTAPTGVVITHTSTGLEVMCDSERSQHRNKEIAMQRLKAMVAEKAAEPQPQADVTMVVDAKALRDVLSALIGPGHYIRELQATRSIAKLTGVKNPIDVLLDQFNAQTKG